MAVIISLNIDAGSSRLRSRSLICFISLKERSAVVVDTGSTMAMVSRILMLEKVTHFASLLRNSVASSFNDKLFPSKMTNLIAFHSCLVSVLSTSAGVEKTFPSYSISVVSPKNFRSFSNSATPYLCSCWAFLRTEDAESRQEAQAIFETTADLPADLFQVRLQHSLVEISSCCFQINNPNCKVDDCVMDCGKVLLINGTFLDLL